MTAVDTTLLQQVVMPLVHDPDVLPLYVDADQWTSVPGLGGDAVGGPLGSPTPIRLSEYSVLGAMRGRYAFVVPSRRRVSFGSYFNAFPASYWARWTALTGVRLSVQTSGIGQVLVYRSNARGVGQRVASVAVAGDHTAEFDLSFTNFGDGGWYWFDLVAEDDDFVLERAGWHARASEGVAPVGSVSVAITTLNRVDFVMPLLAGIAADAEVLSLLDRVYLVDQGTDRVSAAEGFAALDAAFGGKLTVIEQDNLGGSGGFSRGMHETVAAGESDYVLLLDDDAAVEPEGIRRMVCFADYAKQPSIVGGHMFDMYDKSKLHAFAEGFDLSTFMWGPVSPTRHDFSTSNLRQTRWMHRRMDAQYNGWWMCLIPVSVIRELGLSIPVFIKWDDAEYGLRAAEHGIPTVSLPGSAVWHVSWVDKDDSIDWQAFFHARNRLLVALLHSPHSRGGALGRANFALDVKYLFAMQYFAAAARIEAYRSILAGPAALHGELRGRLGAVRQLLHEHPDGKAIPLSQLETPVRVRSTVEEARWVPTQPPTGAARARWLFATLLRNLRPARRDQHAVPQTTLSFEDARWWVVPRFDNVLVTNAEGSGALWYRRDRATFIAMFRESRRLRRQIRRGWPRLAREYRAALPELVSERQWAATFGAPPPASLD